MKRQSSKMIGKQVFFSPVHSRPEWLTMVTIGNLTTLACRYCTGFITLRDEQPLDGDSETGPILPILLHDSGCARLDQLKKIVREK